MPYKYVRKSKRFLEWIFKFCKRDGGTTKETLGAMNDRKKWFYTL